MSIFIPKPTTKISVFNWGAEKLPEFPEASTGASWASPNFGKPQSDAGEPSRILGSFIQRALGYQ